jgi:hypothetical protein
MQQVIVPYKFGLKVLRSRLRKSSFGLEVRASCCNDDLKLSSAVDADGRLYERMVKGSREKWNFVDAEDDVTAGLIVPNLMPTKLPACRPANVN